ERRIAIVQTDLLLDDAPQFLDTLAQRQPVFVAFDRQEVLAFNLAARFPHLVRIAEFPNPYSSEAMYLYHVVLE
ncbi:MAG TPA: hypothetical protein VFT99_17310, partial [Roseiflexaceae bacterium]|nr:hypothetical protein [Roseiflexaceae bacterium]